MVDSNMGIFEELKDNDIFKETCSNLAIAFYNTGIEEEYFKNYGKALMNYENALITSNDNLGSEN
jgi:hypothetical protein